MQFFDKLLQKIPDHYETEPENELEDACPVCHGKKIVFQDAIQLMHICRRCRGRGSVDWVNKATGNPPDEITDKQLELRLAVENAQVLAMKIKEVLAKINVDTRVSVEVVKYEPYYATPGAYKKQQISRSTLFTI